jgi:hypothetical protein
MGAFLDMITGLANGGVDLSVWLPLAALAIGFILGFGLLVTIVKMIVRSILPVGKI